MPSIVSNNSHIPVDVVEVGHLGGPALLPRGRRACLLLRLVLGRRVARLALALHHFADRLRRFPNARNDVVTRRSVRDIT